MTYRGHRSAFARHAFRPRVEALEVRTNPSHTFTVDDDGAQTNHKADFTSIQAAVTAASPGDRIKVYAGIYHEQVVIPATKDNLTITAVNSGNNSGKGEHEEGGNSGFNSNVIIAPTAFTDPTEAVIHVAGAEGVAISGFTITGASAPAGAGKGANYGVLVDMGGSASVRDNHITAIRDIPLSGVQEGVGVQFGFTNGMGGILSTGTGSVTHNLIDDYQKGGVVVIGAGSKASVTENVIKGAGPTAVIAQNGVQVSNGATGTVERNTISGNKFTGGGTEGTGVLVHQTANVTVRNNFVFANDEGILLFHAKNVTVDGNISNGNTFNGIGLFDTTGSNVRHNVTEFNGFDGINLEMSSGNTVEDNFAAFNGRYGIALEADSTGNTVRHNHLRNNAVGDLFVGNPANNVSQNETGHGGNGHGGHGHHGHPDPCD